MSFKHVRRSRRWLTVATLAGAFAVAGSASTAPIPQLLSLGPVTVANGTATVTGSVGGAGVGDQVLVNGHAASIDAAGNFAATVGLDNASSIDISLATGTGQQVDFAIPLNLVGPDGVIDGSVVDAVEQAGVQLLAPVGGIQSLGDHPLTLAGSVADKSQLASLTVNGKDVSSLIGSDRTFSVQLPGTTKEVTVQATDKNGVTETTHYKVLDASGLLTTPYGASVAAANAQGIKIAKIRYVTKRVAKTKRVQMLVVVKDRRGYLVRGAKITVRSKAARVLRKRTQAMKSNKTGRATFLLRVKPRALGKRLVMVTVARTPVAKAAKTTSVRLAKARTAKKHR